MHLAPRSPLSYRLCGPRSVVRVHQISLPEAVLHESRRVTIVLTVCRANHVSYCHCYRHLRDTGHTRPIYQTLCLRSIYECTCRHLRPELEVFGKSSISFRPRGSLMPGLAEHPRALQSDRQESTDSGSRPKTLSFEGSLTRAG